MDQIKLTEREQKEESDGQAGESECGETGDGEV